MSKEEKMDLLPIMNPLFNLREVCKQMALLEDHLNNPRKRCSDCIRKHFLTIEALFEEAVSLDKELQYQEYLDGKAQEIRDLQGSWSDSKDGRDSHRNHLVISQALRAMRKSFAPVCFDVRNLNKKSSLNFCGYKKQAGFIREFLREFPPTALFLRLIAEKRSPKIVVKQWVDQFREDYFEKLYKNEGLVSKSHVQKYADNSKKSLSDLFLNSSFEGESKKSDAYFKAHKDVEKRNFLSFVDKNNKHEKEITKEFETLKRQVSKLSEGDVIKFTFFPSSGYLVVLDAKNMTFAWAEASMLRRVFQYGDLTFLKERKLSVQMKLVKNEKLGLPAHILITTEGKPSNSIFSPSKINNSLIMKTPAPKGFSLTPARTAGVGGDCYQANGRYFQDNSFKNKSLKLVHGEVMGQGSLNGITYGHCWCEDNSFVYDFSNGGKIKLPKDVYYLIGRIKEIDNFYKYSNKEFIDKIMEFEHWGPWDLKTRSGL